MYDSEYRETYESQEQSYAPPTSGSAIASLIFSILGLVGVLPIIGSVVGLILGYSARREIGERPNALGGDGLAQAGIVVGWVGIAFLVLLLCLVAAGFVAIPGIALCAGLLDSLRW